MGNTFTPDQLAHMFEAFDRARRASSEHPDIIASRIIDAATVGVRDVDALFAAATRSADGTLGHGPKRPMSNGSQEQSGVSTP